MTHKQAREELKDNIRRLYGVKTSHYVNFEPRLTQLLELVDQYTEQKILEAKIKELTDLRKRDTQRNWISVWDFRNQIRERLSKLEAQLAKIKEGNIDETI